MKAENITKENEMIYEDVKKEKQTTESQIAAKNSIEKMLKLRATTIKSKESQTKQI